GSVGDITPASFGTPVDLAVGTNPYFIATGDFDGDLKPEILVSSYNSQFTSIFQNNTTPGAISLANFGSRLDFSNAGLPLGLMISDLDGDGKLDWAAAL